MKHNSAPKPAAKITSKTASKPSGRTRTRTKVALPSSKQVSSAPKNSVSKNSVSKNSVSRKATVQKPASGSVARPHNTGNLSRNRNIHDPSLMFSPPSSIPAPPPVLLSKNPTVPLLSLGTLPLRSKQEDSSELFEDLYTKTSSAALALALSANLVSFDQLSDLQ